MKVYRLNQKTLKKALNIQPDNFEIINDIANSYQAIGDNITAKEYYKNGSYRNSDEFVVPTNCFRIVIVESLRPSLSSVRRVFITAFGIL